MNYVPYLLVAVAILSEARAQDVKRDIPYADPAHERQVFDVYSPMYCRSRTRAEGARPRLRASVWL